jgi:uncharacterized protein (DUF58 family)
MVWLRSSRTVDGADERVAVSFRQLLALEHQARGFSFLPRQPARSVLSGRHGSRLRGRGLDFEELRHYRLGDDIRSMDWKTTNRTGRPHVRVYTEERERSVHLLVDQRISMFFGSVYKMKSVIAAEVAALAAWRVLGVGDRLGAELFGDTRQLSLPPQRSRGRVLYLLRELARYNAALAAGQGLAAAALNAALERAARAMSHDALLIYIGDGTGWDAATEKLVQRIAQHNDVIVVHVSDAAETELPARAGLVLSDGRRQIALPGDDDTLRQRFADAQREHVARMHTTLTRFGLPLIEVDTGSEALPQLLRALGAPR